MSSDRIRGCVVSVLLTFGLASQDPGAASLAPILEGMPARGVAGVQPGTEQWIVHFDKRSFDLAAVRTAVHASRPAAEVSALLADIEQRMQQDQAGFVRDVQQLGGRVVRQWWIVNAAEVEIAPAQLDALRRLANVRLVEPEFVRTPSILESTNASNHNADLLQAWGFNGQGTTIAIIDTGQDENMGGSGRPHRTYFVGGNPANLTGGGIGGSRLLINRQIGSMPADDVNGHGTGVASIAAGEYWGIAQADKGHAPLAGIAGYAIANFTNGNSNTGTMAAALQQVAVDRAVYGIVAANLSYTGNSNPIGIEQQAMDSLALNFNVLCCQAAGNLAGNTAASPSVANGLAVGAVTHNTHLVAAFSAVGPLSGDPTRFYPDITGCGVGINTAYPDQENVYSSADGTSEASPQVAGAATQLRARFPSLTALETKAVLLAGTLDISSQNPGLNRNSFGMGLLKNDRAHHLVASHNYGSGTVAIGSPNLVTIPVVEGRTVTIAIAWHRHDVASSNWSNLDLVVRNASTLAVLGSSTSPRNLYELVRVTPTFTGDLRIDTTAVSLAGLGGGPQPFSWACGVDTPPLRDVVDYGVGCAGSGQPLPVCGGVNPAGGAVQNGSAIAGSVAFQVIVPSPITIEGIEVLARSADGVDPISVSLLTDTGSGPSQLPYAIANATTAGSAGGYVRAMFAAPVSIAGSVYVGLSVNTSTTVGLQAGATPFSYYRTNIFSPWQQLGSIRPSIRLLCAGGGTGATPRFDIGGTDPLRFGISTPLLVSGANPNSFAACGIGFTEGNANLGFVGAPLCNLFTSAEILLATTVDSRGLGTAFLPLPANCDAFYLEIYGQFAVLDPTNAFGLVLSNAMRLTVGP